MAFFSKKSKKLKKVLFVVLGCTLLLGIGGVFLLNLKAPEPSYCAFCDPKVINAQKFYEDEHVLALYTHRPIFPGHCLVIPKRHIERYEGLSEEETLEMHRTLNKVNRAVEKAFGTSSYLLLQKNGQEVGQSVPHVHFHYIPRKTGEDSTIAFLVQMYRVNLQKPIDSTKMEENIAKMQQAMDPVR